MNTKGTGSTLTLGKKRYGVTKNNITAVSKVNCRSVVHDLTIDCGGESFSVLCGTKNYGEYVEFFATFPEYKISPAVVFDDVELTAREILSAFKSITDVAFRYDDCWLTKMAEEISKVITPLLNDF